MGKTSMTLGFLVGRQIAGQRRKKGTLVGYSYNGVVLPGNPPEFQFAVVFMSSSSTKLWFFNTYEYGTFWGSRCINVIKTDGFQYYDVDNNKWVLDTNDNGLSSASLLLENLAWANFSILNEDGSTYLAKSDPIPVYE